MSDLKVVPMPMSSFVADIPLQLRRLADRIEADEIDARAVMCIVPQDTSLPLIFLWGNNHGPHGDIGILELAKEAIVRRFNTEQET